uniref:Uncharacterized protein n=1 Tax=Oryza punctata TaxID=4537 RepID=A0A0E0LIQ8_ORYPU
MTPAARSVWATPTATETNTHVAYDFYDDELTAIADRRPTACYKFSTLPDVIALGAWPVCMGSSSDAAAAAAKIAAPRADRRRRSPAAKAKAKQHLYVVLNDRKNACTIHKLDIDGPTAAA